MGARVAEYVGEQKVSCVRGSPLSALGASDLYQSSLAERFCFQYKNKIKAMQSVEHCVSTLGTG